jgi:hypothetical protein
LELLEIFSALGITSNKKPLGWFEICSFYKNL